MLTLWHNLIKSETWTESAALFLAGAAVRQLSFPFRWPSLTCQKHHLVLFAQGPDIQLPRVNLRSELWFGLLLGHSPARPIWRACVTAGVVGCGRGASEGFTVAQWLSSAPWPGACVHGQRWVNVHITGWELGWSLWVCVSSCCLFYGLW